MKSIFEKINSKQQPFLEISRINEMLNQNDGVYMTENSFSLNAGTPTSAIKCIDDVLFKSWKQRGTCINCRDFERTLGIYPIPNSATQLTNEFIFTYCEYAANMVYLLRRNASYEYHLTDVIYAIEDNVKSFLAWYNYELKYYPKEEKVLVIQTNPYATSVAENIKNDTLSYSVIEYNHYLLKRNISKKKEILVSLGKDLEPRRQEIALINKKLEDSIFFMLNNLDLRHNNRTEGDKNYKEKVATMSKSKLEKWYDELYQLILTAYLCLESVNRIKAVDKLKTEIK